MSATTERNLGTSARRDLSLASLDELRAAIHRDPRRVADKAVDFVVSARESGDWAQLSGALSTLGRARLSLGDIDLAEVSLNGALDAAGTAGDDELAADAHLGLAAVLSQAGRSAEAFDHLDLTARLGSDRLQAHSLLQRAVVQRRLGQRREALASFDSALPTLRRMNARVDIAKVLFNRAVGRVHLGHCDSAIADLAEAGQLYAAEGDDFAVAQTRHGLGWAHGRRGDVPQALAHLDAATEIFARHGHDALEVDVDRIGVLLCAGLYVAAGELAGRTADRLHAAGDHSTAAETWLLRGQTALLDNDRQAALTYSERARAMYAEQGATGWEMAARLQVLRCTDGRTSELLAVATALDAAGNARGAATALALAALASCRDGDVHTASGLVARCRANAAAKGLFEVRMQAAHAGAVCAAARGDRRSARRQIRSALRDLAAHRTTLAATDAQAAVAVHAEELTALGLQLALDSASPPTLLRWIELARAGRGKAVLPRPSGDEVLAADLTQLRSVIARLREGDEQASDNGALLARQRDLEASIHRRQLRAETPRSGSHPAPASVTDLRRAVGDGVLIELVAIGTRLTGVVLDARPARIVDVGSVEHVYGAARTLGSALRAAVTAAQAKQRAPRDMIRRCLSMLDGALVEATAGEGPVTLVVPPALHTVPWNLLPRLAGRGVSVAPSATWWLSVQDDETSVTGPAALVAGPRLVEAEREVHAIADSYPGATVLTGPAATAEAVLAALPTAPVAHLACHGRVRHDNPLWSALELADGPLHVYDLEPLPRTPPFVVLSGCESGVGVRAGDQLLGLSAALLERGTRKVVASICPLPDSAATRRTMAALHTLVAGGASVSAALAALSRDALDDGHEEALMASCLSCFGAG